MRMKKKNKWIIPVLVIVLLAGAWLFYRSNNQIEKRVDEYQKVYELLKDEDYKTARVEGTKLCLCDESFTTIREIELGYKPHYKVKYIQNRGSNVIVWYSGFDDLEGIMFLNGDWTDEVWDGIMRAEKIQGNAYFVSTTR